MRWLFDGTTVHSLIFIFFRTHVLGFFWVALVSWIRTGELDNGCVFENLSHSSRRPNFMVVDKNTAISDIEVSLSLTCYIFVLSLSCNNKTYWRTPSRASFEEMILISFWSTRMWQKWWDISFSKKKNRQLYKRPVVTSCFLCQSILQSFFTFPGAPCPWRPLCPTACDPRDSQQGQVRFALNPISLMKFRLQHCTCTIWGKVSSIQQDY